ncbi:OmpA family protein [Nonomuraea sp. SBT364]|uniref:OmpA family protein n=1 Tax=Nonomuraea sp. SBT364 TaxID=1580530 RepID=UPI0018CD78B8|nr:OmpA family protein [Nonomuraea sp. SBT364]
MSLVSACGTVPDAAPSPTPPSPPPTATTSAPAPATATSTPSVTPGRTALAETRSTLTPALKVEVVGLNRVQGEHLVVQVRLSNTATRGRISWPGELGDGTRPLGARRWASGIGVLDTRERSWILPYQPEDSPCLCSDTSRDGLSRTLDPGESVTLYAVTPAPAGEPATATVVTPAAPPMPGVPISDEPPVPAPGMNIPSPGAQPVSTVVRRIVTPSESLDKSEESADDGERLHVNLSSDVLFAVNKATLTSRARAVLARTAERIDASTGPTVRVEGHADSSGNDAINDPLSRRRAQAVREALTGLITRDEVSFEVEGYGSRKPLYSNSTEEGKRRNRRVTVTFARPEPAQPTPAATPAPTVSPDATGLSGTARAGGQPISLRVTGLRRLPDGLGLLTYRIGNEGTEEVSIQELHQAQDWMSFNRRAAQNIVLTDAERGRLYRPGRLQVPDGGDVDLYCACTDTSGVRLFSSRFGPRQARDLWALFELPPAAATMRVKVAAFDELEVPVQ